MLLRPRRSFQCVFADFCHRFLSVPLPRRGRGWREAPGEGPSSAASRHLLPALRGEGLSYYRPRMEPITVAFQGERGAFSEEAARKLLGDSIEAVACRTFEDAFAAVV